MKALGTLWRCNPQLSDRDTLAGISTTPSSGQTARIMRDQRNNQVQEGCAPRRPLSRLHGNNCHNFIDNYGVENTSRMHIPSNKDISRPSESDARKGSWWPESKHIMVVVQKNATMIQNLFR